MRSYVYQPQWRRVPNTYLQQNHELFYYKKFRPPSKRAIIVLRLCPREEDDDDDPDEDKLFDSSYGQEAAEEEAQEAEDMEALERGYDDPYETDASMRSIWDSGKENSDACDSDDDERPCKKVIRRRGDQWKEGRMLFATKFLRRERKHGNAVWAVEVEKSKPSELRWKLHERRRFRSSH